MSCPGGTGYQGYLLVCDKVLPYLTADITEVTEILPSASIHGGGGGVVNPVYRDQHNFAIGRKIVEGSVSCEVFGGTGNYAVAFGHMLDRAIGADSTDMTDVCNGFDLTCKLIFSPAGGHEILLPSASAAQPKALIQSLELRGNNGGVVQATFRVISAGADYNATAVSAPASSQLAFETAGSSDDNNPIPYYASNFTVVGSGETGLSTGEVITDWNISINNNISPYYTFNGENFPQDIILGQRVVTGSFSYYRPDGIFLRNFTHGASITVTFGSLTLTIPFAAFGRSPIPATGPNAVVTRQVEFSGYAKSATEPSIYQS